MASEMYHHKEIEERSLAKWEKADLFSPKIEKGKKPFSLFLVPPNSSGPLHIGNAFMVALQDIVVRYHRALGDATFWIPCTDHGGYETQVSFERELEKQGKSKADFSSQELFLGVQQFVEDNTTIIKRQLKALGASVDWSRFRFTMDKDSLSAVIETFRKMVADNLIYRRLYMVSYCPQCTTFLADIELKETQAEMPLYHVQFKIQDEDGHLALATSRPEFLFSVTHVLIHPTDQRYSGYIGKTLINPTTGKPVQVVASKRKQDSAETEQGLSPFSPSFKKYDYEYTLRHSLPYTNLLDWEGKLVERYPGLMPSEARAKELSYLEEKGCIEKVDNSHVDRVLLCKRAHPTENLIVFTWFLRLDDEKNPLRKPALQAIEREHLEIFPRWKKKALVEWMGKMHDWPIARQNPWGIKIPVWYDVSVPEHFMVWFADKGGERHYGNLKTFLDQGISFEEISRGLERVYANEGAAWVLEKEDGKPYLPESDTFDTWFSSGQWATIVYGKPDAPDFSYFYPSESIVIGYDLLRLSVSRKILLSFYATRKLPFKIVYLHPLLKGKDGQKMSKSLGNVAPLEYYLEKFGADATRMALVSYAESKEDFYFSEERLEFFQDFSRRLWQVGQAVDLVNSYKIPSHGVIPTSGDGKNILLAADDLAGAVGSAIRRYLFSSAQEKACHFLSELEEYVEKMQSGGNIQHAMLALREAFKKYPIVLHPFMPFMTEQLYGDLYGGSLLAAASWPRIQAKRAFPRHPVRSRSIRLKDLNQARLKRR